VSRDKIKNITPANENPVSDIQEAVDKIWHHFFLTELIIAPIIPTIIPGMQIKNATLSAIVSFIVSPLPILSRIVITSTSSKRIATHTPIRIK
jgi:hypothetical protein